MVTTRLFHVSDRGDIEHFEPRPPPSSDSGVHTPVVWAIADTLLHNYLLPRDCPRVTFYAGENSTCIDIQRFLSLTGARHVVAIESAWLARVCTQPLWLYEFPTDRFECIDDRARGAGYHVSHHAVTPLCVQRIDNSLDALCARNVELRVMPSLWRLRDAVLASSLEFSLIRMRNAQPRDGEPGASSSARISARADQSLGIAQRSARR
ncbi:MAG: DUF6886 family protein [Panacagrimonas sp.]